MEIYKPFLLFKYDELVESSCDKKIPKKLYQHTFVSLGITAMDTAMKIQDKKKAYKLFVLFCICHKLSNI